MHELSIAQALLEVARPHIPPQSRPRRVTVEVGPLQAIDAEAMSWSWQAARQATEFESTELELIFLPWQLVCRDCGTAWESAALETPCRCGGPGRPVGGDELRLISLDVEVEGEADEGSSR